MNDNRRYVYCVHCPWLTLDEFKDITQWADNTESATVDISLSNIQTAIYKIIISNAGDALYFKLRFGEFIHQEYRE